MKKKPVRERKRAPEKPPIDYRVWRRHALLVAALWAITLLAYSNSFRSGFVFDNFFLIVQDPRVHDATSQNIGLILNEEYWYNSSSTGLYRPLSTLSYLFNYAILGNGNHPAPYHWVNFALHAINIALVYLLALVILKETVPALAMAAVWGLHPAATESVTNIIGRSDVLAAFGVLAGLLCHIHGAYASGRRKLAWLFALMLAAGVGIFSKESAVALLAVMVLYDFAFQAGAPLRARIPGYLALAPPFAAYFYLRSQVLAKLPAVHPLVVSNPLLGTDFWTARLTAVKVIGKYLWLLVCPVHLSNDYSYNQIPLFGWGLNNGEDWKTLLALASCAAIAAVGLLCYRRNRPAFFFIAFFFVTLAPTANLVILVGTIMAERLLYLPVVGFAGCLVMAAYAASQRIPAAWPGSRVIAPVALALVCAAFAIRTYARNFDWLDERSLWSSSLKEAPDSVAPHLTWVGILADSNDPELRGAIAEMERSLAIVDSLPDKYNDPNVYNKAGLLYCRKGDMLAPSPQSKEWYQRSLAALLRARKIAVAVREENRRIDLSHGDRPSERDATSIDMALAVTYMRMAEPAAAANVLQPLPVQWPQPQFFERMSAIYSVIGDPRQAAVTLIEGLVSNPGYTQLAAGLAQLYRRIDPGGCAIRGAGKSASLNMQCPLVHNDLCTASRNVYREWLRRNQETAANQIRQGAVNDLGCAAEIFN